MVHYGYQHRYRDFAKSSYCFQSRKSNVIALIRCFDTQNTLVTRYRQTTVIIHTYILKIYLPPCMQKFFKIVSVGRFFLHFQSEQKISRSVNL